MPIKSLTKMSRKNVAIYVLLAVLVVLVVYFVVKNREGFNSENSQVVVVYFFFVDWCPHCTNAKPIVEEVQAQYANNNNVEIRAINCEDPANKELVKENQVQAYPTVKTNTGVEMDSSVTAANLNEFIQQQLQ
jgi:thiol-disulfide isomerase/thioredoxin